MGTGELRPADEAARTAGAARQLLGGIFLWGLLWLVLTATLRPRLPGLLSMLHVVSPVVLGVVSVFLWRTVVAYRAFER